MNFLKTEEKQSENIFVQTNFLWVWILLLYREYLVDNGHFHFRAK